MIFDFLTPKPRAKTLKQCLRENNIAYFDNRMEHDLKNAITEWIIQKREIIPKVDFNIKYEDAKLKLLQAGYQTAIKELLDELAFNKPKQTEELK
jgi:hypothetical protein